jgi:hypothetical protein
MGFQTKSHNVDDNIDFILFYGGGVATLTWGAQSTFIMGNKVAFLEKKLKVFKLGFGPQKNRSRFEQM